MIPAMKSTRAKVTDVEAGPGAPRSKADRAYEFIRQRLIDGHRAPGERLVIEQIAREIDVSVVPVREAMRRLEAEGYVTYTRNVGATVSSIDMDRYPETVEALAVLEGAAIGLAAAHVTAKDLKEARALNAQMRRIVDAVDPPKFTATNQQFHLTLYRRCPNRHLVNMVVKEWALIAATRKSAFAFIPERAAGSVAEHEQLLQLIEAGRPCEEIETFARGHRMRTARYLLQHLGAEMSDDSDVTEAAP